MSSKWSEEAIIEQLDHVCKSLGHFPTQPELRQAKRSDLINAIRRSGKTTSHYQLMLGHTGRKPIGYWDDKIETVLQEVATDLGRFPTSKELTHLGKHGIVHAIHSQGHSYAYYQKKLGYKQRAHPRNYWHSWANLEKELRPLTLDGRFPPLTEIYNCLGGGAIRSISRFGGVVAVAEKMGFQNVYFYTATDGHHVHSHCEYLFDEFLSHHKVPHEVNGLIHPDYNYRFDFRVEDVFVEIWGYAKSSKWQVAEQYNDKRKTKESLYKMLGLKLLSVEGDVFKLDMPELQAYLSGLLNGAGVRVARDGSTFSPVITNPQRVWTEEIVIADLTKVRDELGKMPTKRYLINNGHADLVAAIDKRGGMFKFATLLGENCKKPKGYWTRERILSQLHEIEQSLNRKAKLKDLHKAGRSDLAAAIGDRGGINNHR